MFTLPVRPWQLVLSKLLTALLTLVVTGLVSFVSVGILFGGIRGLLPSIHTSLEQSFGGIINGWGIALLVLLVVVQVAVSVLQPGATILTLILYGAISLDNDCTVLLSAAFIPP